MEPTAFADVLRYVCIRKAAQEVSTMPSPKTVDASTDAASRRKSPDGADPSGRPARLDLVSLLKAYSVPKPNDYDWKDDYANALEEKYAGIR
jgi:hypothetical protein